MLGTTGDTCSRPASIVSAALPAPLSIVLNFVGRSPCSSALALLVLAFSRLRRDNSCVFAEAGGQKKGADIRGQRPGDTGLPHRTRRVTERCDM